jgi:hypothetical protein
VCCWYQQSVLVLVCEPYHCCQMCGRKSEVLSISSPVTMEGVTVLKTHAVNCTCVRVCACVYLLSLIPSVAVQSSRGFTLLCCGLSVWLVPGVPTALLWLDITRENKQTNKQTKRAVLRVFFCKANKLVASS